MASRKSPLSGRSAPKAKPRLAAFSAYVETLANGETPATDMALVRALNKRNVMQCSTLWKIFCQQVSGATDRQQSSARVLPPSQALPPLP
ncbi:hypothetical protein [Noviherbaspirillum sp. ST9]|uniref:hypothetical protein n=1 Tax=Noviherbaspirillum sp. ST9 TaxID=3401606 RepID=UPI003B586912